MSKRPVRGSRPQQRLDPATRRAQLVEAAADVFRGRDPGDVSLEEVAEAGGVSRSLVYAYFGDRSGLISSVYVHHLEQLDHELGWMLDEGLPDEVRLRRIVRRYLVFARDNDASWNLLTAVGSLHHPAIQAARRDRIARIAAAWGASPTARLVAQAVVGLLEAGAQDWVDHRDAGLDPATDVLFAVLWEGLTGLRDGGTVAAS